MLYPKFIFAAIVFQLLLLFLYTTGGDQDDSTAYFIIRYGHFALTIIFCSEALLKLTALTPSLYIRRPRNCFRLFVAVVCLIDTTLEFLPDGSGMIGSCAGPSVIDHNSHHGLRRSLLRLCRPLRAVELLSLLVHHDSIRMILTSVRTSGPMILEVAILLVLAIVFFAMLGHVVYQDNAAVLLDDYNLHLSFHSTLSSIFVILVLTSGEGLPDFYVALEDELLHFRAFTTAYFILVTTIMSIVMLNLFVVVICEVYEVIAHEERDKIECGLRGFMKAWSFVNPKSDFLPPGRLVQLLRLAPPPLGVGMNGSSLDLHALAELDEETQQEGLPFNYLLVMLVRIYMHQNESLPPYAVDKFFKDRSYREHSAHGVVRRYAKKWIKAANLTSSSRDDASDQNNSRLLSLFSSPIDEEWGSSSALFGTKFGISI